MTKALLIDQAEAFRALHHGDRPLVLPNAWDGATAALVERAGYPAVASTSAGVAFVRGYADGEVISREEMASCVADMVRVVSLPVTADMETGYGPSLDDVAETVRQTLAAGAIGINLEDGIDHVAGTVFELPAAVERIAAARAAAVDAGIPLVINGRTDVYFSKEMTAADKKAAAIERCNAYLEAGADCAFVIAVGGAEEISDLAREIDGPLNIIAGSGGHDINALSDMGVRRISLGGSLTRAAYGHFEKALAEINTTGTLNCLDGAIPHPEMNKLLAGN